MLRRFLGTRGGLRVLLALEAVLMFLALPRVLTGAGGPIYFATFWGTATVLYFSNYRIWRWLKGPR